FVTGFIADGGASGGLLENSNLDTTSGVFANSTAVSWRTREETCFPIQYRLRRVRTNAWFQYTTPVPTYARKRAQASHQPFQSSACMMPVTPVSCRLVNRLRVSVF